MTQGALVWLAVFSVAAILFFVIALVAGVRGFFDLATLLRGADQHPPRGTPDRGSDA